MAVKEMEAKYLEAEADLLGALDLIVNMKVGPRPVVLAKRIPSKGPETWSHTIFICLQAMFAWQGFQCELLGQFPVRPFSSFSNLSWAVWAPRCQVQGQTKAPHQERPAGWSVLF